MLAPPSRPKAPPGTPVFTMADYARWQAELRDLEALQKRRDAEFRAETEERARAIAALKRRVEHAGALIKEMSPGKGAESPAPLKPDKADSQQSDLLSLAPRPARNSIAAETEQIVRRVALERKNEGFVPMDVRAIVDTDPNVSEALRGAHWNTIYTVLRYMRGYKWLTKEGRLYKMTEKGFDSTAPRAPLSATIEPFQTTKEVPLTQREMARMATRKLLEDHGGGPVHRSAIAEYLVKSGVFGPSVRMPVERLSQYLAKWREFAPDGKGNYRLIETRKEPE